MVVVTLTDCPPKLRGDLPNGFWKLIRVYMLEKSMHV